MLQDLSKIINTFLDFYLLEKKEIIENKKLNLDIANRYSFLHSPENLDAHFSVNFLMLLRQVENAEIIFEKFTSFIKDNNILYFENIFFTNPGFINFKIYKKYIFNFFFDISINFDKNLIPDIGKKEKINIEYVSCNPTGPMHIGHTRGAIVGDAVCSIFEKVNYKVTREFCINDNGNQFEKLVESVIFRYENLDKNASEEDLFSVMIEKGLYPGGYITDVAKKLKKNLQAKEGDVKNNLVEKMNFVKNFALSEIMKDIKKVLKRMKIAHDEFVSVQNLIDNTDLNLILENLNKKNLLYYSQKIGEDEECSENKEDGKFLLFRSTAFGDDKDRVLLRKDKTLTYFGGDVIYHKDKIARGCKKMYLFAGEDHKGYQKRLTSIVNSLDEGASIEVVLVNLVKFQKNGEEIKMSKRKGNFLTAEDVLDEIPVDILRFIILSYKRNSNILFDFEKHISESKENPVFYVQYCYSRISSTLNKIEETYDDFKLIVDFKSFQDYKNINLVYSEFYNFDKIFSKLLFYPEVLKQAVKQLDPSILITYIIDLSGLFHSSWAYGNENNKKFITEDKKETLKNYIILKSIKNIIKSILDLFKIEAMEKM